MINKAFFALLLLSTLTFAYSIVGDCVTYGNVYGAITQCPHTITSTDQFIYINLTANFTSNVDGAFGFDTDQARPVQAWVYSGGNWVDISNRFATRQFNGKTWYIIENTSFDFDTKELRARVLTKINASGKYDIALKRSVDDWATGTRVLLDPWYNASWGYRKEIIINTTIATDIYSVPFTFFVDTATLVGLGQMQADCDDLRITDVNSYSVSYFLVNGTCNTANTTVVALMNLTHGIGAGGVNNTYYLYFNNSAAINAENSTLLFANANVTRAYYFDTFAPGSLVFGSKFIDYAGKNNATVNSTSSLSNVTRPTGIARAFQPGFSQTIAGNVTTTVSPYIFITNNGSFVIKAWLNVSAGFRQKDPLLGTTAAIASGGTLWFRASDTVGFPLGITGDGGVTNLMSNATGTGKIQNDTYDVYGFRMTGPCTGELFVDGSAVGAGAWCGGAAPGNASTSTYQIGRAYYTDATRFNQSFPGHIEYLVMFNETKTQDFMRVMTGAANVSFSGSSLSYGNFTTPSIFKCGMVANGLPIANFTLYDEENLTVMNGTFQGTFNLSNSTYSTTLSWQENNTQTFALCMGDGSIPLFPTTPVYYLSSFQTYYSNLSLSTYPQRYYFLVNASVSPNVTALISFYLENSTFAKQTTIKVSDESGQPSAGVYVSFLRYYPSTNEFLTVAMTQTDSQGTGSTYLRPSDVYHKVIVYTAAGTVLYVSTSSPIACDPAASSCSLNIILPRTAVGYYWQYYNKLGSNCTNFTIGANPVLACTFNDASGLTRNITLTLTRLGFPNAVVCENTTTSQSGVLICYIPTTTDRYTYILTGNINPFIVFQSGELDFTTVYANFGNFGLFLAMLLIMTIVFAGVWLGSPPIVAGLVVVGVLLAWTAGTLAFSVGSIAAIVIMGMSIIYMTRKS